MAKIHIENGIISSSADYSLYHGTSKVADVKQDEIRVQGDLIAENYIVSSSTTYVTTSFSDGSTKFGDTPADTHQFTGSLQLSGSMEIDYGNIVMNGQVASSYTEIQMLNYQGSSRIILGGGSGGSLGNTTAIVGGYGSGGAGGELYLQTENTGDTLTTAITIDNAQNVKLAGNISGSSTSTGSFGSVHTAGNVGIGNTNPTALLTI